MGLVLLRAWPTLGTSTKASRAASPVSSGGSGAGRREAVNDEAAGSVPYRCCMHWPLPSQTSASLSILPSESPGNVAAHVRPFHFQGGLARNTGREPGFRVLQLTLTSSLDRISRPRHIPPFQWGTSSHSAGIGGSPIEATKHLTR